MRLIKTGVVGMWTGKFVQELVWCYWCYDGHGTSTIFA